MGRSILPVLVRILFFGLFSSVGLSFPDSARHGYLSCSTCHFSPSGRGLLTPYGKTLAHELYSVWKTENKNESLNSQTPWWHLGAQLRLLQFVHDSKSIQKARFFPMQAEVEGALEHEKISLVTSVSTWRPLETPDKKLRSYSPNHYLLFRPTENWMVRLGHFRMSHGLGLPDHSALILEGLGWTHSHETYNLEASYLDEDNVWQATWIAPSKILATDETFSGTSIAIERLFSSKHRGGLNFSSFKRNEINESQINLHGVASITEKTYLQTEVGHRLVDLKSKRLQHTAFWGRFSHIAPLGFRPFLQWEKASFQELGRSSAERYYVGTEWFPMVHIDLMVFAGKEFQTFQEARTVFMAIGHVYF
jgi:hypothetical protein